jgi:putative PIN family toxin of toxin-antitoxin system
MADKHFVIDTNVFVSAMLFPASTSGQVVRQASLMGNIVLSSRIAQELSITLSETKFDKYISLENRFALLSNILLMAKKFEPAEEVRACRDSKDDMFLELAVACKASAIVTGDKALLELHPFRDISIITPIQFLKLF